MGTALFAAATAGLLATSAFLVASLRLRSVVAFVLGGFTVAWMAAVVETMLLSLARSWTRGWMLAAIAAGLVLALASWQRAGRPRPPALAPALEDARDSLGDPVLVLLAAANALAGVYLVVVALALPPFDLDIVVYHLPRIVMWIQRHAVAAIPNAPGSNLNANRRVQRSRRGSRCCSRRATATPRFSRSSASRSGRSRSRGPRAGSASTAAPRSSAACSTPRSRSSHSRRRPRTTTLPSRPRS